MLMKKVKLFLACLLAVLTTVLYAQNRQISGTVTDTNGDPVPGASVIVEGTTTGAVTDLNGNYTVNVRNGSALQFSFFGMKTVRVPIGPSNRIDVVLEEDAMGLDEAVVVAMGITRSEKSLGYSATTVKSEDIIGQRATNVTSALAGKVAGLQISSSSSDPGAANSVTIRGFSSINGSNQPLYVVDGIPLSTQNVTTQGHSMAAGGIANISPDDIESMTVLKGAAATALYGSRAANGVIIVTTKSGKANADRDFSIEYNGGVQARQVNLLYKFQNDFGQGWNGTQTFIENGSWGPKFDGTRQVYGPIWNKQQLIHDYKAVPNNVRDFFDTGLTQNHSLSFSGVSNDRKMTYYLSYAYTGDDGVIPTDADKYTRNTIAMRNSYAPVDWVKVSSQMNFTRSKSDVVGSFQGTSMIDGILELPRDISLADMRDISNPFFTPEAYLTPYGITNPYWSIANRKNHTDSKQIFGKVQVDVTPLKGLTFSYRFGFDYSDYDRKVGAPQISLDDALIDNDYGYAPSNMNEDGFVYTQYLRRYEINNDFLASYKNKFFNERLDLAATVGVNMNERASTRMAGQADVLTFHSGFWDLANGASWSELSESQWMRRLVGAFGDVSLGWDDTIFLTLTARNDWSSTLPIDNNSFFYPGVTLSYIFTNHLPKNNYLSFGKVRLAYGKTGNDADVYNTNPVYYQASFNGYYGNDIANFPINGTNAFRRTYSISSSTLRPEMTTEFEIGTNLQFFNGRFGIDAAYYNRVTTDQIFSVNIDPAVGYTSAVTNFGDVSNKGYEILLNFTPIQTKKVRWDLEVNFARNFSKVVSLPAELKAEGEDHGKVNIYGFSAGNDSVQMYAEEGMPLGTYWTYLPKYVSDQATLGKDDDGKDIPNPYYDPTGKNVGKLIVGEDGQPIQGSELEYTGYDMNHKWTGGLTSTLTVGNVSLSASLDVRYGGKMFSRSKSIMQFTGNGIITTYNERRPFVIPNSVMMTGDQTFEENTQAILMTDSSYQDYFDDHGAGEAGVFYLLDRTFAKLRNVTLTYNLPKKWCGPFRGLGVSAFVNNAFIWTPSTNYYIDPEGTTTSSDIDLRGQFGELYVNPSCRIYGFNVNIKF